MKQTWMIRAEGGLLIDMFLTKGVAALGGSELGSFKQYKDRDSFIKIIAKCFPSNSMGATINSTGIYSRFCNVISIDDNVVTYDRSKRVYHIGTVVSDYCYDPGFSEKWPNIRKIKWHSQISRDKLSASSKNILGSTLTIFKIPDQVFSEMMGNNTGIDNIKEVELDTEIEEINIFDEIQEKSIEFIKDKFSKLDWEEMQELVAGLLRAMGYKTKVSPKGSDLGKDIVASPDGFGLEQPRIVVEVKHRTQPMGSQEIRSFLGGRHKDDKGLYVSTGGFTKDAKYEADRASIPLTLMDIDDLVTEIIKNYEELDVQTKILLPLKRVYWPAT